jgi:hypothetical protein
MSAIFSLVGVVFLVSGLLSIANITDVGLDFISNSQIHLLPFLNTFPGEWVYVGLGLILLAISGGISRR